MNPTLNSDATAPHAIALRGMRRGLTIVIAYFLILTVLFAEPRGQTITWARHPTAVDYARWLSDAGLEIADTRFVNAPGALAGWLMARRLGQIPTRAGAAGIYDRIIVPFERRPERVISPPFGQSLLCVARRPG